ncbi:MAG: hypothetical protein K6A95_03150 [Bacteroidales bacterium]|nr:hypothetical protein [Bacteroidales bacterium]
MKRDNEYKLISAGVTLVSFALLIVFLVFCGFTYLDPPPQPENQVEVMVQEIELAEDMGGGNLMDGGNFNPQKPTPSPEVPPTPTKTGMRNNTPTTNTATSPTGPKANVPEQPKPNSSAMFGTDKVGTGQNASTAGGNTSGHGGASGHGDGLGYGNAAGSGGGTGGGTGSGSGKPGWAIAPNWSGITSPQDFTFTLKVTVDDNGNVTDVRRGSNCNAPENIVNQAIARIKSAKFKKGFAGTYDQPCSIKKNN